MGNADLVRNWFDRDRVPRKLGEPGEPEVATGGETGAKTKDGKKEHNVLGTAGDNISSINPCPASIFLLSAQ